MLWYGMAFIMLTSIRVPGQGTFPSVEVSARVAAPGSVFEGGRIVPGVFMVGSQRSCDGLFHPFPSQEHVFARANAVAL